jgi:hypothetical protein
MLLNGSVQKISLHQSPRPTGKSPESSLTHMGKSRLTKILKTHGLFCGLLICLQISVFQRVRHSRHDARHTQVCKRCVYTALVLTPGGYHIDISQTTGTGRTGNIARNIWRATTQAHACKGTLRLPAVDFYQAFLPSDADRLLDFRHRLGPTHPRCIYPTRITGNLAVFNNWNFSAPYEVDAETSLLGDCLRNYFGFCTQNYCATSSSAKKNVLVAHVRNGDIFPPHFKPTPHVTMGQPPLSYYLSIFAYKTWAKIIVIAEPSPFHNPVYDALLMMNKSGAIATDFQTNRSTSWAEDLKSLICADSIIMNQSSLFSILPLGFSRNMFFLSCTPPVFRTKGMRLFRSQWTLPYTAIRNHTNRAEEWVEMLLTPAGTPPIEECSVRLRSGA